ncbi:unnamed protein product, partial [Closterium sp. NIES-54]
MAARIASYATAASATSATAAASAASTAATDASTPATTPTTTPAPSTASTTTSTAPASPTSTPAPLALAGAASPARGRRSADRLETTEPPFRPCHCRRCAYSCRRGPIEAVVAAPLNPPVERLQLPVPRLPYRRLVSIFPTRATHAHALPACYYACLPAEPRRLAELSRSAEPRHSAELRHPARAAFVVPTAIAVPTTTAAIAAPAPTAPTATTAATSGGQMQLQQRPRESLTPQQLREWYTSRGCGGGRSGNRPGAGQSGASCSGQLQLLRRPRETLTPQHLREWYAQNRGSWSTVRCPYVIRTGAPAGQTCGTVGHTQTRCFAGLSDAWHTKFGDDAELPTWLELLRQRVDNFALDYDAIITTMYALPT